jgi:hypothetical protein
MVKRLQGLSHIVWELRFLSMTAQTAHWRVFGPTAYTDHLLFGRIYEKLDELLDPLAERLTALSKFDDEKYVCPLSQARYVYKRTKKLFPRLQKALLSSDLASLFFYEQLLSLTQRMRGLSSELKVEGFLTFGLEDLLASTADDLETLVYFLERRSQLSVTRPLPEPIQVSKPPQHTRELCSCGVVLSRCRCIGPTVDSISSAPCTHTPKEKSQGFPDPRPLSPFFSY